MRNLDGIKKAWKLIQAAEEALGQGPASFYFEELLASYDLLMSRFCPYKVGERVILRMTPIIENTHSPGWLPYKSFLVKGALGVICSAECGRDGFIFSVEFVGHDGRYFAFKESYLAHEGEEI